MRVTNGMIAANTQNYIQKGMQKLARTQEMVSTTKKIIRLSDEPNSLSLLLNVRDSVDMNQQYMRNIKDGLSYLDTADGALGTEGELLQKTLEYAVQGATGTMDKDDMAAIGEQVDKMVDELVDIANSTVGGKYIFAGTKNNRPPFAREGNTITYSGNQDRVYREILDKASYGIDAPSVVKAQVDLCNPSDGGVGLGADVNPVSDGDLIVNDISIALTNNAVDPTTIKTYEDIAQELKDNGFDVEFERDATTNTPVKFVVSSNTGPLTVKESQDGVLGSTTAFATNPESADAGLFGFVDENTGEVSGGVFKTLFDLVDNLKNGIATEYTNGELSGGAAYSIDEINQEIDHALQFRVRLGARTRHFESVQKQLEDQEVRLNQVMSNLEDVDMAKVSIDLAQYQLAYNASLASGAQIMQVSLLNYLR